MPPIYWYKRNHIVHTDANSTILMQNKAQSSFWYLWCMYAYLSHISNRYMPLLFHYENYFSPNKLLNLLPKYVVQHYLQCPLPALYVITSNDYMIYCCINTIRTTPLVHMIEACASRQHGPVTNYAKLRVVHAPGMPGTFSAPLPVSDPSMHHGMCVVAIWQDAHGLLVR